MISRRNIRIKVLQTLYQVELQESAGNKPDPVKQLKTKLEETTKLFFYLLYFVTEVARYAERDAGNRAAKNIVTKEDLDVNIKISGNTLLWKILENKSFQKALAHYNSSLPDSTAWIKKIYTNLTNSEVYKNYSAKQERDKDSEREILEFIFIDLMMSSEEFDVFMADNFNCWYDDVDIMISLMLNYFQRPGSYNLMQLDGDIKWNFAKDLLLAAIEKKEYVLGLIKPRLRNWDPERIAIIDMQIMRLGICEFLYFDTIPPKVTINEYIDLAKEYSTTHSGQFVNGVLDSIHKDLVKENKMHKADFKQEQSTKENT